MKNIKCSKKKYKKSYFEEDAETITTGTSTPTAISAATPVSTSQDDQENEQPDPMIAYILQQLQKNKEKQVQDAQMDYAYRQQQADQIIKDIEDYIQKNTKSK